jgi:hypothetical protein
MEDHLEAAEDAGRAIELDPQLAAAHHEKGCAPHAAAAAA